VNEEPCAIARSVAPIFGEPRIDHHRNFAQSAAGLALSPTAVHSLFDYKTTPICRKQNRLIRAITFRRRWQLRKALDQADVNDHRDRSLLTKSNAASRRGSIRARGWDHRLTAISTALACANLMNLDPEKTRHRGDLLPAACAAMRQARVGELSHWKGVAFATRPVTEFIRHFRSRRNDRPPRFLKVKWVLKNSSASPLACRRKIL